MERPVYRKLVLSALDAFLLETPESVARGTALIDTCWTALRQESEWFTLDGLIWSTYVQPLTDPVFFTSREYLLITRQSLLEFSTSRREKVFIKQDFRPVLTMSEVALYEHLLKMLAFVQGFPHAQIAESVTEARRNKVPGQRIIDTTPEGQTVRVANEEYEQYKTILTVLLAALPTPEQFGAETVYRLALREVSDLLADIDLRFSAIFKGYPSAFTRFSIVGEKAGDDDTDLTWSLAWASRALAALAGTGSLLISWQFACASSFETDLLLVSLC